MSKWKKNLYPGDATDRLIRNAVQELASHQSLKAVAIVVIDKDGNGRGQIAMQGVGFVGAEAQALQTRLSENLHTYSAELNSHALTKGEK